MTKDQCLKSKQSCLKTKQSDRVAMQTAQAKKVHHSAPLYERAPPSRALPPGKGANTLAPFPGPIPLLEQPQANNRNKPHNTHPASSGVLPPGGCAPQGSDPRLAPSDSGLRPESSLASCQKKSGRASCPPSGHPAPRPPRPASALRASAWAGGETPQNAAAKGRVNHPLPVFTPPSPFSARSVTS